MYLPACLVFVLNVRDHYPQYDRRCQYTRSHSKRAVRFRGIPLNRRYPPREIKDLTGTPGSAIGRKH